MAACGRRNWPSPAHTWSPGGPLRRRGAPRILDGDARGGDEPVGPDATGDRPFGVRPHGDTRDTEPARLLLEAPRVGDHQPGVGDQPQHLQVRQRLEQPHTVPAPPAPPPPPPRRPPTPSPREAPPPPPRAAGGW